jgi:hypothetical protein
MVTGLSYNYGVVEAQAVVLTELHHLEAEVVEQVSMFMDR